MTALYIAPVIFLVTVLAHFLPNWTRPDLFFAVTVDPEFRRTPDGARVLRQYRLIIWIGAVASAGLAAASFAEFSILQVFGFLIALARAHRRTLAHATAPSAILEVNLAAPPETFPGGFFIAFPPLAALAALAFWANSHWEQLPAKIPVHWGIHGADRFVERTTQGEYGLIAIHGAICMGLVLCAWGILHWSRRVSTVGAPAASERRFRRLNVQMLILIAYFATAQAWMVLLRPDAMGVWWGVLLLVVLLPFLIRLVRIARTGTSVPVGDRTPDSCWKLGIFYINPEDPSIFVAKRFGIGYTFNFGNRWSWAVMAAILVVLFARAVLK
jgi:uncharacterized membrane protein